MEYDYIECGDCLELMNDIPDGSIDMILCYLPYGTTKNKWDSVIPFEPLWEQYNRVIKDNAAIVLFSQMPFTVDLVASNYKDFRYEWIWEKLSASGHLNANRMPMKKHENILVFYKKLPTYNPQFTKGKPYVATRSKHSSNYGKQKDNTTTINDGKRYPVDIIKFNNDRGLHTTQKPVELLEYLIKTYTNEGEIVLDNCMGSGSTCVACVNTNRHYIGFELDQQYYDIACKRLDEVENMK